MNFFVVHFIDFRNGLTFADKKLKCLIILMCSFMHYVRGLVAQNSSGVTKKRTSVAQGRQQYILTTIMFHPKRKSVIKELIVACIL